MSSAVLTDPFLGPASPIALNASLEGAGEADEIKLELQRDFVNQTASFDLVSPVYSVRTVSLQALAFEMFVLLDFKIVMSRMLAPLTPSSTCSCWKRSARASRSRPSFEHSRARYL